ncbi:hypothetical protein LSAT2_030781 [Lamellibrachia satsuma]|nr:hypothetical protein LSAT2_030781 [Lamellibrachia satsuma]
MRNTRPRRDTARSAKYLLQRAGFCISTIKDNISSTGNRRSEKGESCTVSSLRESLTPSEANTAKTSGKRCLGIAEMWTASRPRVGDKFTVQGIFRYTTVNNPNR